MSTGNWIERRDLARIAWTTIPVLDPGSEPRRRRWQQVLTWYGLRGESREIAKLPVATHDAVIANNVAYAPLARWYARLWKRPFYNLSNGVPLKQQIERWNPASILLIGPRDAFSGAFIEEMNWAFQGPWGLITGIDLPGVSFVLAKQIGLIQGLTSKNRTLILDEIGNVACIYNRRKTTKKVFETQAISIVDEDWRTAILRVHGEGSHANLRSIVLCGRSHSMELDFNGKRVPGCMGTGNAVVCKRVHRSGIRVATFGDVRAASLCLYSCNAFSVNGELYPSDLSGVLSASEGYPASMLCNDRPGCSEGETLEACQCLLAQGHSLAEVSMLENDRQERYDGDRPWLLFGDPIATPQVEGSRASELVLLNLPSPTKRVWRAKPHEVVRKLFVGRKKATILLNRSLPPGAVRISNVSDLHRQRFGWLVTKARAVDICSDIELNSSYVFGLGLAQSSSFRSQLTRLSTIRTQLSETLGLALRCYERASRLCAWDSYLDPMWQLCETLVMKWDRAFSRIVFRHMMNGDIESLALHGTKLRIKRAKHNCMRCGRVLTLLEGLDVTTGNVQRCALRCPLCGSQAAWFKEGPRINATQPPIVRKGTTCEIEVSIDDPISREYSSAGILLVTARDKGSGNNFFSRTTELHTSKAQIQVEFPRSLTSDLHTIRIIWVSALRFAFVRFRCSAVRATGSK